MLQLTISFSITCPLFASDGSVRFEYCDFAESFILLSFGMVNLYNMYSHLHCDVESYCFVFELEQQFFDSCWKSFA